MQQSLNGAGVRWARASRSINIYREVVKCQKGDQKRKSGDEG